MIHYLKILPNRVLDNFEFENLRKQIYEEVSSKKSNEKKLKFLNQILDDIEERDDDVLKFKGNLFSSIKDAPSVIFGKDQFSKFDERLAFLLYDYLEILKEVRLYIEVYLIPSIESEKPQKKRKKKITYNWLGKDDELPELCRKLIKEEFIDAETTPEQFKTVFTGKTINDDFKPLRWLLEATDLLYFIMQLQVKGLLEKTKRMDYIKMTKCFVDEEGSEFDKNFKQMKTEIKIKVPAQKQKKIDDLINDFT